PVSEAVEGSSRLRARELLPVAALLIVLLLLFLSTPIVRGEVLSPADLLFLFSPWAPDAPAGYRPANPLLSDYVLQFRPWRTLGIRAWKEGRVPLWDPSNSAGAPLLGNGISALLSPLNVPFFVLPEAPAVLVWAAARLFVAAFGTYAFARVVGL